MVLLSLTRCGAGVVVAVRGVHEPGGDFLVQDLLFAGMPAQPPRPVLQEAKYIAFVSGLRLSSSSTDLLQVRGPQSKAQGCGGLQAERRCPAAHVVAVLPSWGPQSMTCSCSACCAARRCTTRWTC